MTKDLHELTLIEASALLNSREISSEELTTSVLNRIEAVEEKVHAFVTVTRDKALKDAKSADKKRSSGENGPLLGIPGAIKDNMCVENVPTTCSSRMLENFIPPYNAHVVDLLAGAGAVIIGKTNMDEFAMGSSTENSAFFPTHNPWNTEYVPGGSSGGSAAAVAAGEGFFALGSDTGGSIRQPASFCGVVGLKPTYGRISRYGLVAFGSSLDQIGPLTSTVAGSAAVLNAIAGHDNRDSTSIPETPPDYTKSLDHEIKGVRIGVVKELLNDGIDSSIRSAILKAVEVLEKSGAIVDLDASLPSIQHALSVYYIIAPAEVSANLARYDGVKYGYSPVDDGTMWEVMEKAREFGFGPEVKRRILLGTYALSAGYYDAYYKKAQQVRTLIRQEYTNAFEKYDVLLSPTTPTLPFKIGEKTADPVAMYLNDICTIPTNIAGIPSISLQCGIEDGLPIGLQISGKPLDEEMVLRVAYAYEQQTTWHTTRPSL
ncbi:MAG: Asp-tRNA(Asn)/Glu-tRNA(Gln) amidotransferase subunit GatA [SAR202 cluster bacterium]|nr:Asp-tRNA(Asn)/Glu-tRNA(Gln) amidotransferase subunit GatA [SAR202 cluster bacterium]|tara:strand:+ start:1697 stop:3160 length:1464 start_codon:yes stop_codon:yes gene_type:complete